LSSSSIKEDAEEAIPFVLKQRTKEWEDLRNNRLTASRFATALGFYGNYRRSELWAQKLGLRETFPGNTATDWGIRREAAAIRKYEEYTRVKVKYLAFQIYKEGDKTKDWLGGSPDGLIEAGDLSDEVGGILEVKCPYNQGKPEFSIPWNGVPHYFIPQVQGLMEILDREWADLFVWTMNGSAIYMLERDPAYWELIFEVLNDFWWGSVVPGKKALLSQKTIDVNAFKPILRHKLTPTAVKESKRIAKKAIMVKKFFE
jgi:putative phage-type endonuclease